MSDPTFERRHVTLQDAPLELRAERGARTLSGYAAVFDTRSADLGGFVEQIRRGAFASSLKSGKDIRALVDHETRLLLGRTTTKTLSLKEDRKGLAFTVKLPRTSYADDLLELVRRGDVAGMSFGFTALAEEWDMEGEIVVRTLTNIDLGEITVTSIPAYSGTSVSERSLVSASAAAAARRLAGGLEHHELDVAIAELELKTDPAFLSTREEAAP